MDSPEFLAHIAEDGRKQSAQQHCRNAAKYASMQWAVLAFPIQHISLLCCTIQENSSRSLQIIYWMLS